MGRSKVFWVCVTRSEHPGVFSHAVKAKSAEDALRSAAGVYPDYDQVWIDTSRTP